MSLDVYSYAENKSSVHVVPIMGREGMQLLRSDIPAAVPGEIHYRSAL